MFPIAVAALTAVCFVPAWSGSFLNWDDDVNFLSNTAYRGFGPEQIRWAFTSVLYGHYIPLTRLTFSLNYVLGGMDPRGYHVFNVLLHAVNAASSMSWSDGFWPRRATAAVRIAAATSTFLLPLRSPRSCSAFIPSEWSPWPGSPLAPTCSVPHSSS
jgi:hypothetical protein